MEQMTTLNSQKDTLVDGSTLTAIPIGGGAEDSQIETLEPYEQRWQTVNRKKSKEKKRKKYKADCRNGKLIEGKLYFKSIYTIKFPGINIREDLNLIKTDDELSAAC